MHGSSTASNARRTGRPRNGWTAYALTAVLVAVLTASAWAQSPGTRPYESEEDLWEALRQDEITYDEFLELIDLYRLGTEDRIVPPSDWEELPGSDAGYLTAPDSLQPLTAESSAPTPSGTPVEWTLRGGYDAKLSTPPGGDGYTIGRLSWGEWRALVDWQQDGDRPQWRRRTLVWNHPDISVQWGSVEPRWGRGLVIGRRSRVFTPSETEGTFWQPVRSRFNGVWIATDSERPVQGELVLSDIRSQELTDRVAGVQLTSGRSLWRVGVSALTGDVEQRDSGATYARRVVGAHVRYGAGGRELLAEIATADNGASARAAEAVWRLSRGRIHARAWSYADGYVNPWGGGPGASDTRSVVLDGLNDMYASRTAGERGFALTTNLSASRRMTWRWEWMTHRESAHSPVEHDGTVRLRWHRRAWTVTPYLRGRHPGEGPDIYALGAYGGWNSRDRKIEGRCEWGRHRSGGDHYVRTGVGGRWRVNRHVSLSPACRWVDPDLDASGDGYWYLYCTETIRSGDGLRLEAALVWQRYEDRDRGDQVELRLRFVADAP